MDYSYESDHTKFMREYLDKNPEVRDKRAQARNMWWDKKQDLQERKRFEESSVPMKPYVYFNG